MRNLYSIILMLLSFQLVAQVPQKMSYQAVIRTANNNLLSLKNISMRISILKGELTSSPVYIETHNGKTNLNGLVSIQIGTGLVVLGVFSKIDWSKGPYFIATETDPDGGYDYSINGKSELLSVPYALYALNNSNFDTSSLHNRIIELQFQANENKININMNLDSIKVNAADIKVNLDSIKVNTIKIANAITIEGDDNIDLKSNGNLKSSKNISLTGNIESLGESSSIGTIIKPFKDLFISSHSLYIASDVVGQNIPPTILSNVKGNLEISAGGLRLVGADQAFIAPRVISTLTGNASTATKFETPRMINGIAFDGSANITIPIGSVSEEVGYDQLKGTIPIWNQSTIGNAATVTTNANLIGIVTSVGNETAIANGVILNSMLSNEAVANLSGSNTGDQILPTLASLGAVASNFTLLGATKTKITYDEKGLVTSGVNATTADIAVSANKNYVTDIQAGVISNTSGINTGDQVLPSLVNLRRSENEADPYFDETGLLSKLTLSSNITDRQTEDLDLTKTIHKLNGKDIRTYFLRDGFEGQVIYILPFGDDTNLSDITITILNGTIWSLNMLVTGDEIRPIIWTPFSTKRPSDTMAMAIFTEKKWFLTGGSSAIGR